MNIKLFELLCISIVSCGLNGMEQLPAKDLVRQELPAPAGWWQRTKRWLWGTPFNVGRPVVECGEWDRRIHAQVPEAYAAHQREPHDGPLDWPIAPMYCATQLSQLCAIAKEWKSTIRKKSWRNGIMASGALIGAGIFENLCFHHRLSKGDLAIAVVWEQLPEFLPNFIWNDLCVNMPTI